MPPALVTFNKSLNATGLRELVLFTFAALLASSYLAHAALVSPVKSRLDRANRDAERLAGEVTELQQQLAAAESGDDLASRLETLQREYDAANTAVSVVGVGPEEAERLFARIAEDLKGAEGVKVLALTSRKAARRAPKAPDGVPTLVRHDFDLKLGGQYPQLSALLARIAGSFPQVRWGTLRYGVGEYPRATLELRLYVFSYLEDVTDV